MCYQLTEEFGRILEGGGGIESWRARFEHNLRRLPKWCIHPDDFFFRFVFKKNQKNCFNSRHAKIALSFWATFLFCVGVFVRRFELWFALWNWICVATTNYILFFESVYIPPNREFFCEANVWLVKSFEMLEVCNKNNVIWAVQIEQQKCQCLLNFFVLHWSNNIKLQLKKLESISKLLKVWKTKFS